MTKEELKNKCTERAKIFQQAMESCHSSSPIDCIEWFADRIATLEKENAELKDDNKVMADNYSKMEQKFYDNLTKAEELLKQWLQTSKASGCDNINIVTDTKQFISEVEK